MTIDVQMLARAMAELSVSLPPERTKDLAEAGAELLAKNGRLRDLHLLPASLRRMLRKYGPIVVNVETASPLSDTELKLLEQALTKAIPRSIVLSVRENPGLIGGLKLRVADERFDASLRGALDRIPALFAA